MGNVKLFFRLLGIAAKLDLMWLLRDTRYAIGIILSEVVAFLSSLSGIFLIALRFGGIGGITADEVLFMLAFSTMVNGLLGLFGTANNIHISRIIGRGQLEHMFQQPVPLWMQLTTMGFCPFTGIQTLVAGGVLLTIAVGRLELAVTPGWLAALVLYLAASLTILVARCYLASTAAFYAPVAAEEICSTVTGGTFMLGTFPLSGMPKAIQIPLLTLPILPEGLIAWFPALCLLGKPPLGLTAYYPMLFAMLLSLLTAYLFKKGLNHYVRKGSNRYVPHGFRR